MAIKLQVQQQANGRSAAFEAASTDLTRNFGDKQTQIYGLPKYDATAAINSVLREGDQVAKFAELGQKALVTGVGLYANHVSAEDNLRQQQVKLDLIKKGAEIEAKNQDRLLKGEISAAQLADANKNDFDVESRSIIENVPYNLPKSRDDAYVIANSVGVQQYTRDLDYIAKHNADVANNTLKSTLSTISEMADAGPEGFAQAQKLFVDFKTNNPLYQLNPAGNDVIINNSLQKSALNNLAILAKENPTKYQQLKDEGVLENTYGAYVHNPETWTSLDNDANTAKLKQENQIYEQRSKASVDTYWSIKLKDVKLTDEEIKNYPGLMDVAKVRLLADNEQERQKIFNENKSIIEIEQKKASVGNGTTLTNEEMNKDFLNSHTNIINELKKNPEQAILIMDQVSNFYGGRVPDALVNALNTNPPTGKEREWAGSIIQITSNFPDAKINKRYSDIALIMNEVGQDGKLLSFATANELLQTRTKTLNDVNQQEKISKELNLERFDSYKKPEERVLELLNKDTGILSNKKSIGDVTQLPVGLISQFKTEFRKQAILTPNASEQDLASLAMGKVLDGNNPNGFGYNELGNNRYMQGSPLSKYTPEQYQVFKSNVENYVSEKNMDNYGVMQHPINKNSYSLIDYSDPNNPKIVVDEYGHPKAFTPDREIKVDFNGDKGQFLKSLENQFQSTIGQFPGVMSKIYKVESASGRNISTSSAGAKGHFQFIDSTAKQYGVDNPNDFSQSASGAAKYMDDLLKKYNGNLTYALAGYNWGPGNVDKWIKNGAKFSELPSETRNYIKQINTYG